MLAALLVAVSFSSARAGRDRTERDHRRRKVMIISTFGSEAGLAGLSCTAARHRVRAWRRLPDVHCNHPKSS
jgi:hypothetical protein